MLNLPFNKWTLKFHSPEFEKQYEEHVNKVKVICFRSINAFASLVAFASLIIFIVQQKSTYLNVLAASVLGICFTLSVLSERLKPLMRLIYSSVHVVGTGLYIIVNLSGIDIPYGILGYSLGCSTMGIIQYSDNRLKIIYIITTPCILLAIFDIFQIDYLHYVFYAYTSMIFTGVLAYMNEYTSRLAFALNIIANKQKDIINEFVQDAMFAISFDNRKNQFFLEFHNMKFEKDFDIKETDEMKVFLRSSFFANKTMVSMKTRMDLFIQKKQQSLEEYLYEQLKKKSCFCEETELLPEIFYLTFDEQQQQIYKTIQISLKIMDYGKPLMLLVIKSNNNPKINDRHQCKISLVKHQIRQFSTQLAQRQQYLYQQSKLIKVNSYDQRQLLNILCLNLQLLNTIRNLIVFLSKDKIYNLIRINKAFIFHEYMNSIGLYCQNMAHQQNRKFKMANLTAQNLQIQVNSQLLTQLILNIFECILRESANQKQITLFIREVQDGDPLNENKNKFNQIKLLSFTFYPYKNVDEYIPIHESINPNITQISELILSVLGPYNHSFQVKDEANDRYGLANQIIFYVYQDQGLVEQSYLKQIRYSTNG